VLVYIFSTGFVRGSFNSIFKGNWYNLEERLDVDHGLLAKLVDSEVITTRQRSAIEVTFVVYISFLLNIVAFSEVITSSI